MAAPRPRRSGGFTYLSLIILVAIIGMVTASALKLGSVIQRSRAEQELLEIGAAFSDALQSYADATPPGMPTQPPTLNSLLKDPRFPGVRRHLRKLFVDPMTGKPEWGITYLATRSGCWRCTACRMRSRSRSAISPRASKAWRASRRFRNGVSRRPASLARRDLAWRRWRFRRWPRRASRRLRRRECP
jgi:type II secretory pathway pseudopilin PulG